MTIRAFAGLAAVAALTLHATGQDSPLSGPTLLGDERQGLVRLAYDGTLEPLDAHPADLAARLLDLDDQSRVAVARVLAERAAIIDAIIRDNFDLLITLTTANEAGDKLAIAQGLATLGAQMGPLVQRGRLANEIRTVLPEAHLARYDALLDEYWDAVVMTARDEARSQGRRPEGRIAILMGAGAEQFFKEIERAYERLEATGTFFAEYLLRDLELTAEQRTVIEPILTDLGAKSMESGVSDDDYGIIFLRIFAHLTEPQRQVLIERIQGL